MSRALQSGDAGRQERAGLFVELVQRYRLAPGIPTWGGGRPAISNCRRRRSIPKGTIPLESTIDAPLTCEPGKEFTVEIGVRPNNAGNIRVTVPDGWTEVDLVVVLAVAGATSDNADGTIVVRQGGDCTPETFSIRAPSENGSGLIVLKALYFHEGRFLGTAQRVIPVGQTDKQPTPDPLPLLVDAANSSPALTVSMVTLGRGELAWSMQLSPGAKSSLGNGWRGSACHDDCGQRRQF